MSAAGNVESLAFCSALGGWLVLGWIGFGWDDQPTDFEATLTFGIRTVTAEPITCVFEREDVRSLGTGIVIFIPDQRELREMPHDLILRRGDYIFRSALHTAQKPEQHAQIPHARILLAHSVRSQH